MSIPFVCLALQEYHIVPVDCQLDRTTSNHKTDHFLEFTETCPIFLYRPNFEFNGICLHGYREIFHWPDMPKVSNRTSPLLNHMFFDYIWSNLYYSVSTFKLKIKMVSQLSALMVSSKHKKGFRVWNFER